MMQRFLLYTFLIGALCIHGAVNAQEPIEGETDNAEAAAQEAPPPEMATDVQEAQPEIEQKPVASQKAVAPLESTDGEVEIEKGRDHTYTKICNCKYSSDTPYAIRRSRWGGYIGAQSGTYIPENYKPDFRPTKTFANYYGDAKTPLYEITFGVKLNFFLGSLAANFTGGYMTAKNEGDKSNFTVEPVTGSLLLALDNLFKEPYVVPYGMVGMYTALYSESVGGLGVSGNSPFAPFYAGGLMFQLDWIDQDGHIAGYEDFGLENTFVYIEARSFLPATSTTIPDLSTSLQFGGGLKVEF